MRRTVPLIFLFVAFMFLIPGAAATDEEYNVTAITEDGYILWNAGFTRTSGATQIIAGTSNGVTVYRGYVEWDISALPNKTITRVYFYYNGMVYVEACNLTVLTNRPSTTANNTLFWEIGLGNSTIVASEAGFPIVGDQQVITVNATGVAALQNALTAGQAWWAVGLRSTDEAGPADTRSYFTSEEGVGVNPPPTLYVEFIGNYTYVFDGGYYENGTVYGPVDVAYSSPTDDGEFTVNGSTTKQFAIEPTMFYWDIPGGLARYVFSSGSENFTVTIPDDTFYVYSFTIKDHTGKTGLGDCFLEAYRAFGAETLIERMKIYLGNAVPLNLVYGRTYHLKVLFADGSRYDWGYFMAGGVDEINLILKAVTFTDQAQILFNHIHVEATRTATVVTVNYLDDRDNTVWANTTIRIRNGAVVLFAARNNNSYIVNWGGADAATGYMVTVTGLHSDYGTWGRSFILDPGETFPDPPSLAGIYGDVDSTFIAWVITMISLLTFSVAFRARGLVATMFIATILNYLGWASWGYNWLAFGWLIAVGVALTVGGNQ